jgi:hypothetical protein
VILGSQPLQGNAVDVQVVNGAIHAATETRYCLPAAVRCRYRESPDGP